MGSQTADSAIKPGQIDLEYAVEVKPLKLPVRPRMIDIHLVAEGVGPFRDNGSRQTDQGHLFIMLVLALVCGLCNSGQSGGKLWRKPVVQFREIWQRDR